MEPRPELRARPVLRGICLLLAAGFTAGCQPPPAARTSLTGDPAGYLVSIDDLGASGFALNSPPHSAGIAEIAAGDVQAAAALQGSRLEAAATERFFRDVGSLSTSNGPVDVIDTAMRFAESTGAERAMTLDVTRHETRDHQQGISTGPLGDAAHADAALAATGGVSLVQLTVEWRTANVLNIVVIRGRYGGTRIDHALALARRQAGREGGPSRS